MGYVAIYLKINPKLLFNTSFLLKSRKPFSTCPRNVHSHTHTCSLGACNPCVNWQMILFQIRKKGKILDLGISKNNKHKLNFFFPNLTVIYALVLSQYARPPWQHSTMVAKRTGLGSCVSRQTRCSISRLLYEACCTACVVSSSLSWMINQKSFIKCKLPIFKILLK